MKNLCLLLLFTCMGYAMTSCKKKDTSPTVTECNPHMNEEHVNGIAGTGYGQLMTNFWVKDKEYEGDCSSKEISFTGIGHNSFGITILGTALHGSEYTHEADPVEPNWVFSSMTGPILWGDGYDNFILPSNSNISYEVLSVTADYLIVRTSDSPNVLRYKAKYN